MDVRRVNLIKQTSSTLYEMVRSCCAAMTDNIFVRLPRSARFCPFCGEPITLIETIDRVIEVD